MKSTTPLNIVTCLSIKDILTFALECKIYNNEAVRVYLISKRTTRLILKYYYGFTWINYVDEKSLLRDVLGIYSFRDFIKENNIGLIKRSDWYKQQFLKYSQILSLKENSFVVDGDTFPKSIKILTEIKNYRCFISNAPVHQPYEDCINKILGFNKYYDLEKNYVCEAFYMDYYLLNEMLLQIEQRCKEKWPTAILKNVTNILGFSEYQTYARFEEGKLKGLKQRMEFNTTRNFGEIALPGTNSIGNAETDFVSFESYHTAEVAGYKLFKFKKYFFFFLNKLGL